MNGQFIERIKPTSRRNILKSLALGAAALGTGGALTAIETAQASPTPQAMEDPTGRNVKLTAQTNDVKPSALPVTPDTFYQTFAGYDFKSIKSNVTSDFAGIHGSVYVNSSTVGSLFVGVHLPDGVRVTEVTFVYKFNDDSAMARIYFNRSDPTSPLNPTPVVVMNNIITPVSATPQTRTMTLASPLTINNALYHYQLIFEAGVNTPDHAIIGARIGYQGLVGRFKA
jgi:hypothetical protein